MANCYDCSDCVHEAICSKKAHYQNACDRISREVNYTEAGLIIVDVKCSHFLKTTKIRMVGAAEPVSKIKEG